jgi:type IV fimbrial biogenesis protein FimT
VGSGTIQHIATTDEPAQACWRARGFTIVELMITLAVAAILLMIAVPSFKHIIASTNLSNINNDLAGDLQYARTEAASRQVDIAVSASAGGWQNGWNVEIPPASTAAGATAEVLRRHAAISSVYKVAYKADGGSSTSLKFLPQGSIETTGSGACFTISAVRGENNYPRFLQVLPAGMLQHTSDTTTPPTTPDCTSP